MKCTLSFLTTIPVGGDLQNLSETARYMPIFPMVGLFIGCLGGFAAWILIQILPGPVAGALTLGFILMVTGLHHTDGLVDFGDGLVAQGSASRKIEVMKDRQIGVGGLTLGLMVLLTTCFTIASLSSDMVFQGIVVSETTAKFAMVSVASVGRSANPGLGACFIEAMHSGRRFVKLGVALAPSLVVPYLLLGFLGLAVFVVGWVVSLALVGIAEKNFGGVTGDAFGAVNDITRMVGLVSILVMSRWV